MNQNEKQQYLEKLLSEIERTEEFLVSLKEANQPVEPDNAVGRISRMDAINNKSITDNQLRQNESKLKKMKKVLELKDSSDFGLCITCEKAISLARLLYMPQSGTCVNCAR
jgi:DnaK suppressor protein